MNFCHVRFAQAHLPPHRIFTEHVVKSVLDWFLALLLAIIATVMVVRPEPAFRAAVNTWFAAIGIENRIIHAQGFTMRFYEAGKDNKHTVVLLHGLGGNAQYTWLGLMPELAEKYHVIAPKMIYAGLKKLPLSTYSLAQERELVRGLMKELQIRHADFVGLSVGGQLSLRIALDWPEVVQRLVLIAPAGVQGTFPTTVQLGIAEGDAISKWYAKLFYDPPPIPGFVLKMQNEFAITIHSKLSRLLELLQTNTEPIDDRLHKLRKPTLVIWGKDDKVLSPQQGHLIANRIPGAQLIFFPRCGHAVVWDQDKMLQRTVMHFLQTPFPGEED